ncbi:MAG: ABC transporter ATP-binding protein, partial [Acidimicrobiia bacterium]
QRAGLIDLFVRLGAEGRTVIVSSHVLAEVERMTHQVVAMVDGRMAAVGDIQQLRAVMTDKPRRVRIRTDRSRDLASLVWAVPGVEGVQLSDGIVEISSTDPGALAIALPALAVRGGLRITEINPADESMEQVFRYLVESGR